MGDEEGRDGRYGERANSDLSRANFKKSAGKIIFLVTYLLPLAVSH